jgi:hypothetical protein
MPEFLGTNRAHNRLLAMNHTIVLINGVWMTALSWELGQNYTDKGYSVLPRTGPAWKATSNNFGAIKQLRES